MKRFLALLIALVLLISPVYATSTTGSFFDFTDDILENGDLIYYFQEMSLQLPGEWRGKIMTEQLDNGVSFYQKSSHEKYLEEGIQNGGFLFQVGASVNQSFSQLPKFEYLGFCEESAMNYYLRLPTDYPAYNEPDIREEYDKMAGQIDYVVKNVKFYGDRSSGSESSDDSKDDASGDSKQKEEGTATEAPRIETVEDAASAGMTTGLSGTDAVTPEDAAENAGKAGADSAWKAQDVRYFFEHKMLPQYFYDRPESLLAGIYKQGLYYLWELVCKENEAEPFYAEKDYITHWYTDNKTMELVQIELPEPDAATLCYRIYFVYGPDEDQNAYYTVESDEFAPDTTILGTWTKDGTHKIIGTMDVLDKKSSDYEDALKKEAEQIAELANISGDLILDPGALSVSNITASSEKDTAGSTEKDSSASSDQDAASSGQKDEAEAVGEGETETSTERNYDAERLADLQDIDCPQQGFSIKADKSYAWDYQVGTGITIYTDVKDSIPYVIVYQGEDLIAEPFEYINEQYTPYMQKKYGDDLISYEEEKEYSIGGKKLPAGVYQYKLGDYTIEQVRLYDSSGKHTVAYTAKYIKDKGEDTIKALDRAVRYFQATDLER